LERAIVRDRLQKEQEEKDRIEIRARLDIWDDDESDELFYVDRCVSLLFSNIPDFQYQILRARWHHLRARRVEAERAADEKSRLFEEQEVENLRRESDLFLARQMDEMQALAEEQRKAGMLLDDGAPVRLNVSIAPTAISKEKESSGKPEKTAVFAHDEEEEEGIKKRRAPLVKLDFSVAESGEQAKERLERIRRSVPHDKESLFKAKVRWDGLNDVSRFCCI
jgi:RNA-binding protein 25